MCRVIKSVHPQPDGRSLKKGGAVLMVLVVMVTGASMVALVQHTQAQRTMELRLLRAGVETDAALLLGLDTAMKMLSDHFLAFPEDPFPPSTDDMGFLADSGAGIRLSFRDAQDRFDLNWLRNAGVPRESFENLFRSAGGRGGLSALDAWVREPKALDSVDVLPLYLPEAEEWLAGPLREDVTVLPLPSSGVLPLNINAVDADRLVRMLGEPLRGWTEAVLQRRAVEPLQDIQSVLTLLPDAVAAAMQPYLDVRSTFFEVWIEAEYDAVVRQGWALLKRGEGEKMEVIQCRW
jgi:type II secretory pathway component PulK